MFAKKSQTEIIILDHAIHIVGLNLQKSGLPLNSDSIGEMWNIWGKSSDERRPKINNLISPIVEYGICLNNVPDYAVGSAVSEFSGIDDGLFTYTIPAGRYIKDTFNAEDFQKLIGEEMSSRNVKKWARENHLKINGDLTVEVYSMETCENVEFPEIYTLTPIK